MWDKAGWQAALKLGVPSALLVFLIVWLVGDFNVRLGAMNGQHEKLITIGQNTFDAQERGNLSTDRVLRVLQAMCVNDAKNKDARALCLRE